MDKKLEEISSLKPGRYMIMGGTVCVIKSMDKSTPGKHGHAKYRVTAKDLLNGSSKQEVYSGHASVEVPIIDKKNAQVLSISGQTAQIMDLETYETFDAEFDINESDKAKLQENSEVIYWDIMGRKVIKTVK